MSDGSVSTREVVEHPGAVAIVALDDRGEVVLVRQYRHPIGDYLLELPAGLLDVAGEPPWRRRSESCSRRRRCGRRRWDLLVDLLPSPGISTEAIRVYLARDLGRRPDPTSAIVRRARRDHADGSAAARSMRPCSSSFTGELSNAAAVAGVLAAKVAHSHGVARPPISRFTLAGASGTTDPLTCRRIATDRVGAAVVASRQRSSGTGGRNRFSTISPSSEGPPRTRCFRIAAI